jgi:hypothetical protein
MTVTVEPPHLDTPDAGVIEDARARQRRHRRAAGVMVFAGGAAVALLLEFAGGGRGSQSSHSAPPRKRLQHEDLTCLRSHCHSRRQPRRRHRPAQRGRQRHTSSSNHLARRQRAHHQDLQLALTGQPRRNG